MACIAACGDTQGLSDLWRLGRAACMAEIALVLYIAFTSHFVGQPRSVFILDPLLAVVFAGGALSSYPVLARASSKHGSWLHVLTPNLCLRQGVRALLVGADDAGVRFAREIMEQPDSGLHLLGFVDDDPSCIGRGIFQPCMVRLPPWSDW